jgi:histone-lysine N-methyltransferase SETDB1
MHTQTGRVKAAQLKMLSPKHLAYGEAPPVRIPVGTRIIAIYQDPDNNHVNVSDFYSGVVAEPPKERKNGF